MTPLNASDAESVLPAIESDTVTAADAQEQTAESDGEKVRTPLLPKVAGIPLWVTTWQSPSTVVTGPMLVETEYAPWLFWVIVSVAL